MSLKSLNTRYLKLIRKVTVTGVALLLVTVSLLSPTCWSAHATGFNRSAHTDNSTRALQGAAAITYLKEHQLYDSLRATLNAARSRPDNISSLIADEQKLTASDASTIDFFGTSVAISGSTLVVGAPFDSVGSNPFQGSAYVFNRHGGNWVEMQKLTAGDGASADLFGFSVAISGSTIVVGSEADDIGGNIEQGSAYVFSRRGGNWIETQKLTASDGAARDQFGNAVAISGSTLVVNAIIDTVGDNFAQASAYVFSQQGGSWVETQKLTASDGEAFDQFGVSVAISGSTIVVGAPFDDFGATFNQGSAYVFTQQGGTWVETQKLIPSDATPGDQFGWALAVSGSTIVVSAINDRINGNLIQGSAYVFTRQGGGWVETQKLTASDGAEFDFFGDSVAVSGSTIVVGATFSNGNRGSAYVFNRQGGNWVETQKLTASDGEAGDQFGHAVAVGGPTIVVGAPFVGSVNQGAAYVFGP